MCRRRVFNPDRFFTCLFPVQVKACFDDFVNLDLDGSFTLSADEFETWHLQKMARNPPTECQLRKPFFVAFRCFM